ncbi:MAG: GNAT family N-acetyltransferase [Plectolyngbya sp. WJT66-NPBG17]|jgi:putative acetyltransferase|nr:GNAT family N-acetyltransferase [Plectolyngbya sp. WJT66-NPBG17]
MEIQIRLGSSDDLQKLLELQTLSLRAILADTYPSQQLAALVASQSLGRQASSESLFVAEVNGEVVGFSALSDLMPYVTGIYVHPDWIGRGIGATLLRAVEEAAVQKRFQVLKVFTSPTIALFYQSQGYQLQQGVNSWTRNRIEEKVGVSCEFPEKRLIESTRFNWKWASAFLALLLVLFGMQMYHQQRNKLLEFEQFNRSI